MNLQKFIKQAKLQPKVAQEILNALHYEVVEGTAIGTLQDDVTDDPKYHGITPDELIEFISATTNRK